MEQARTEVIEAEIRKDELRFHKKKALWTQIGDRCNKDFFDTVKQRKFNAGIKQLQRSDGTITKNQEEVLATATKFYQDLLTTEPVTVEVARKRQEVWTSITPRVTEEMRNTLTAAFSLEKIEAALQALPQHSCPGEDGLSPVCFKEYWELIKQQLCEAF